MKSIIILLNFLLISLILWSFLNSKVVEYFSGCPSGQNNAVTKQSSQLSENEQRLLKLEMLYQRLFMMSNLQNMQIKSNGKNAKKLSGDILKEKANKEKELEDLEKGYSGGSVANVSGKSPLSKLGKIMASSPNTSV
tara:strand:+ start:98 stop:508 length:411 start_codon:yes stop_codon:yes gene_type:complete